MKPCSTTRRCSSARAWSTGSRFSTLIGRASRRACPRRSRIRRITRFRRATAQSFCTKSCLTYWGLFTRKVSRSRSLTGTKLSLALPFRRSKGTMARKRRSRTRTSGMPRLRVPPVRSTAALGGACSPPNCASYSLALMWSNSFKIGGPAGEGTSFLMPYARHRSRAPKPRRSGTTALG
jgi:hypothetical protein